MKSDIQNREDIERLVNTFYDAVKTDSVIGYLFTDVARIKWEHHLPKMYDFWENILFYTGKYSGSPMIVHRELHQQSTMSEVHFEHWVELFTSTVDHLFAGAKADDIKDRAVHIAQVMMFKTLHR